MIVEVGLLQPHFNTYCLAKSMHFIGSGDKGFIFCRKYLIFKIPPTKQGTFNSQTIY